MKKILLSGSGELGKESVIAAKCAGQYVIARDSYESAPAMQVADESEVIDVLDGTALDAIVDEHKSDLIIPEIEAIRIERLFDYEGRGIQVTPSARAVDFTMNRHAIRNPAARDLGLRTAKYFYAKTYDELKATADEISLPCAAKLLMSSSGHSQNYVHDDEELEEAFKSTMDGTRGDVKEVTIEEFIELENEFTLLTMTQKNGPTLFRPSIGHIQKGGDYREGWQLYAISKKSLRQAEHIANEVTCVLTGYGIWGIELFLTEKGEVIFSELSPHPRDIGMVTLAHTTDFSKFGLYSRAVTGPPIPATHLEHAGCLAVILSPIETDKPLSYNLLDACNGDKTRLCIFGKSIVHVGRRMGAALCYGEAGTDTDAFRDKTKCVVAIVLGTDPYMKR